MLINNLKVSMKNIFFILILVMFLFSCKKKENYHEYFEDIYSLVTSCQFHPCMDREYDFPFYISFDPKDNKYFFTWSHFPWDNGADGTFEIRNNTVLLFPENSNIDDVLGDEHWNNTKNMLNNNWILEYVEIDDSAYCIMGLRGEGITFGAFEGNKLYDNKLKPKRGEHRIVDNIKIVLDGDVGELIENARVRSGPGLNYVPNRTPLDQGGYYPAGEKVMIVGHTLFKRTINGQTGSWFYCILLDPASRAYEDGSILSMSIYHTRGWIFSPLLKILE